MASLEKLSESGVRAMVRVSDARMSGISYDTVILHVAPENALGGPLAVVFVDHVGGAETGADRDSLLESNGSAVPRQAF